MSDRANGEEFRMNDARAGGRIEEPTHGDSIRRISLQTEEGETLIGIPVTTGPIEAVPRIFLTPVRAAMRATALVAKVAKLKIIIE